MLSEIEDDAALKSFAISKPIDQCDVHFKKSTFLFYPIFQVPFNKSFAFSFYKRQNKQFI